MALDGTDKFTRRDGYDLPDHKAEKDEIMEILRFNKTDHRAGYAFPFVIFEKSMKSARMIPNTLFDSPCMQAIGFQDSTGLLLKIIAKNTAR